MIIDRKNRICSVTSSNINLQCRKYNPLIGVREKAREDIEDIESRIDKIFELLLIWFAMTETNFSICRFDHRRFENHFHLILAFLQRWKGGLNKDFSSFQGDLGGSPRVQLAEVFENRCEMFTNCSTLSTWLNVSENGKHEIVL